MTINYNNSFRYSGPTNLPNQLDSYRFANFFNEAAVNQGDKIIFDEETIGRIQDYMAGKSLPLPFLTAATGISMKSQ